MNHRQTHGRLAALGIAVVVAITVAACGGGSSPSSTTTATSSTPAATANPPRSAGGGSGLTSLAACLRQNGVTIPAGALARPRVGTSGTTGRSGFGRRFFGATGGRGLARPGGFFRGATGARGGLGAIAGSPKFAAAFQKCRGLIGVPASGGPGRFGATGAAGFLSTPAIRAQLTRFVACMSKNGMKLPTPNLSGSGTIFPGVNQASTAFKTAYSTCHSLINFLPRGGSPRSTG